MKGILFSNYFLNVYLLVFTGLTLVDMVTSFLKRDKDPPEKKDKSEKNRIKNIRGIVQAIIMLGLIILIIYLVYKYQVKIIIYTFSVSAIILGIVILPYAIWSLIQYIFVKPFDYELTKTRESALGLVGFIMYFVCRIVASNDIGSQINQFLLNSEIVITDLFMMVLLIFWYFVVVFFTLSFFIITLHKVNILIKSKLRNANFNVSRKKLEKEGHFFSNKITEKIDTLPKEKIWKKINYYIIWIICMPIDVVIVLLKVMFVDTSKLLSSVGLRFIKNGIKFVGDILSKNQGKAIIIISRIALVGSMIVVYLIDKYQKVFSIPGSEIYEFMCSVIIIPLLITQLIELKKIRKDVGDLNQEKEL